MSKKIVISAGGTGGHLFPALALAHTLQRQKEVDLFFLGGGLASNCHFDRQAFRYQDIPCGSFVSKNPLKLAKSGFNIARGVGHSLAFLRQHRPDAVVGFGSFYGFPPLVAARMLGIPIILYAADVVPGKVIRLVAPYAAITGTHFFSTPSLLKGKATPVGMPLRDTLVADKTHAGDARRYFGLDPECQTLLVFGGSQGAQRLNELVLESMPALKKQLAARLQVIHFTGSDALVTPLEQAYKQQGISCCVKAFESRMGLAWSAADLALGRSGAGTIAEMQLFGVPAILVPYPFATDAHQDKNAEALVSIGGAVKLSQQALTATQLTAELADLLNDVDGRRSAMQEALYWAKDQAPPQTLADLVWETLNKPKAS